MPASVPLAIVLSEPARGVPPLLEEIDFISRALPGLRLDATFEELRALLGADPTTAAGLELVGVAADEPLILVPDLAGGPWLVVLRLADRRRFQAWLDRTAEPARRVVDAGGERATVLDSPDRPLACVVRPGRALCQIGTSAGDDAIGDLRRFLGGREKTLGDLPGQRRAASALRAGGLAYAIASAEGLAARGGELAVEATARNNRFATPLERKRAEHEAQERAASVRRQAKSVEGLALGLYLDPAGARVDAVTVLDERGAQVAARAFPGAPNDVVRRWSETPSLARLFLRMAPDQASWLLGLAGIKLGSDVLSGSMAAMALAVDTECPAAKSNAIPPLSALPFVVPVAAAIGLAREAKAPPAEMVPWLGGSVQEGGAVAGEIYGSPVELRTAEDVALLATGPGGGAAAARRWNVAREAAARTSSAAPFLIGGVDLRAVSAAIAAGRYTDETRRELWALDALQRHLRMLVRRWHALNVSAVSIPADRRIDWTLRLQR